jgi:CrcB protein
MTWLYVFLGGGLGSVSRYLVSKLAGRYVPGDFPWGTLLANLAACALLAVLVVWLQERPSPWVRPLLIIGFCGGFSTFSTFGNETFQLVQNGHYGIAIANVAISLVAGIGLIFLIRAKA